MRQSVPAGAFMQMISLFAIRMIGYDHVLCADYYCCVNMPAGSKKDS